MPESTSISSIKHYTEKLNGTNFPTWRRELYTAISLLNLDDFLTKDLDAAAALDKHKSDHKKKAKQVTNIIRLHLDGENSARFIDDNEIGVYKPKELWDAICEHYATKSMENRIFRFITSNKSTANGAIATTNKIHETVNVAMLLMTWTSSL